jgi:hypothetical protein
LTGFFLGRQQTIPDYHALCDTVSACQAGHYGTYDDDILISIHFLVHVLYSVRFFLAVCEERLQNLKFHKITTKSGLKQFIT